MDYRNGSDSDGEGLTGLAPEDATEPRASSLAASILGAASPAGVVSAYSAEGGFQVRANLHACPCPAVCACPVCGAHLGARPPGALARSSCAPRSCMFCLNKQWGVYLM